MKSRTINLFRGTRLALLAGLLAGSSFMTGCAAIGDAVLNPYDSDFACAGIAGNGKCASTPEAYQEALAADSKGLQTGGLDAAATVSADTAAASPAESAYREAQLAKMTKLVATPVTPVVVPPTVVRILFLPYPGEDDSLNMPQYVFTMMDKARFIFGDYLMQDTRGM